jgi:hypothetical protein
MHTRFLDPSMIEGVDALLVIGKVKCEDQLLLLRFFLPQPIFPDGDLIHEDFMAHSKGWVVRRLGVQPDLHQSTETSLTFFISQEVFHGKYMDL